MKTRFTVDTGHDVTVEYDDAITGGRERRTFTCPDNGGYVRELVNGDWRQVCEKLYRLGDTLRCNGSVHNLPAVIRREFRAMRRAERRELR